MHWASRMGRKFVLEGFGTTSAEINPHSLPCDSGTASEKVWSDLKPTNEHWFANWSLTGKGMFTGTFPVFLAALPACITCKAPITPLIRGYESLNGNLRLVLLTRVSKWNSDASRQRRIPWECILLTVWLSLVVFINWVSKPMRNLDIKGNFSNSEIPWPQSKIQRSYLLQMKV